MFILTVFRMFHYHSNTNAMEIQNKPIASHRKRTICQCITRTHSVSGRRRRSQMRRGWIRSGILGSRQTWTTRTRKTKGRTPSTPHRRWVGVRHSYRPNLGGGRIGPCRSYAFVDVEGQCVVLWKCAVWTIGSRVFPRKAITRCDATSIHPRTFSSSVRLCVSGRVAQCSGYGRW